MNSRELVVHAHDYVKGCKEFGLTKKQTKDLLKTNDIRILIELFDAYGRIFEYWPVLKKYLMFFNNPSTIHDKIQFFEYAHQYLDLIYKEKEIYHVR